MSRIVPALKPRPKIYNRRPAKVEAMHFDDTYDCIAAITAWVRAAGGRVTRLANGELLIEFGKSIPLKAGDVLVREANGVFYVYNSSAFKALYT